MSDFDAALAKGGSLVAAWDDFDDERKTLTLFEVSAKGAKQLAETNIAREQQQRRSDELIARGLRIGYTVGNNDHVWVIDGDTATVWSNSRVVLDGNRATIRLADEFVQPADVRRVSAFYDANDRGHRGVRFETKGAPVIAAEERDDGVQDDPFYNQDNLVIDALWASYLANDLATWLGVPLDDGIMHIDNASQLRIAKAARELAVEVTRASPHGAFQPLKKAIGQVESIGELTLRYAPSPVSSDGRLLDLIVGGHVGSRAIRKGTNQQIAATLQSVRLPRLVLDTASAVLDQQRR
jgi:hypothetical protein